MGNRKRNYERNCLLFVFVILFVGCKVDQDLKDTINIKNKVLFIENDYEGANYGNIVLFDLDKLNKIELKHKVDSHATPRLTPNGRYLIYFNDEAVAPFFRPIFKIADLLTDKETIVDLKERVSKYQVSFELTSCYEVLNDSVIVFPYQEVLYKYNFLTDELKPIKKIEGKKIWGLALNKKNNEIALMMADGFTSMSKRFVAIVDSSYSIKDTIDISADELGNWSPDGEKLILNGARNNLVIYDRTSKSLESFNDSFGIKDNHFVGLFYRDGILILQNCITDSNYFIYDLKGKSFQKQLTFDKFNRRSQSIYTE